MTDPAMSPEEFALLRRVVLTQTGIALGEAKRALLESRLRKRLRQLGLESFLAYYHLLVGQAGPGELQALADLVTTNTTSFFREPVHYDFLARELVPRWQHAWQRRGSLRLRLWSAASSTGQEAYSLAAVLSAGLGPGALAGAKILGTDISSRALQVAEQGEYPVDQLSAIPASYRAGFVRQVGPEPHLRVAEELKRLVVFRPMNLLSPRYPFHGTFEAILCRNVFIYFDEPTREALVRRLAEQLSEGGYLFLGLSEALVRVPAELEAVGRSIYRRRSPGGQG